MTNHESQNNPQDNPQSKPFNPINVPSQLHALSEFWHPKDIAQFNQMLVKIAKLKGRLVDDGSWHNHPFDDKMFYIVAGQLVIEFKDRTVKVTAGEMVIIPKDTDHRPFAPDEASVMFFEPIPSSSDEVSH